MDVLKYRAHVFNFPKKMTIVSSLYFLLAIFAANDGFAIPKNEVMALKLSTNRMTRTNELPVEVLGYLDMPIKNLSLIVGLPSTATGDVKYTVVTEARNWAEALLYCKFHQMDFATVRSERENQLILGAAEEAGVSSKEISFWVGGTELESNRGYYWVTDIEPLTYSNWIPGQPSGSPQHCLQYWFHGRWGMDDEDCGKDSPFVCEYRS